MRPDEPTPPDVDALSQNVYNAFRDLYLDNRRMRFERKMLFLYTQQKHPTPHTEHRPNMKRFFYDQPSTRATLVGTITAISTYLIHQILIEIPWTLREDVALPPDPVNLILALLGVGIGAGLMAEVHRRRRQHTTSRTPLVRIAHTGWSLTLACALPITQMDGIPLPALWVVVFGLTNGSVWTTMFGILSIGIAASLTRIPSGWITQTFPKTTWALCHTACAWGGWGTAALLAFPILPALVTI